MFERKRTNINNALRGIHNDERFLQEGPLVSCFQYFNHGVMQCLV
jgi:hypothetical protein